MSMQNNNLYKGFGTLIILLTNRCTDVHRLHTRKFEGEYAKDESNIRELCIECMGCYGIISTLRVHIYISWMRDIELDFESNLQAK